MNIEIKDEVLLGIGKKKAIYVNGKYLITVGTSQVSEACQVVSEGHFIENLKLNKSLQGVLLKKLSKILN